jgi:hypothetical protein
MPFLLAELVNDTSAGDMTAIVCKVGGIEFYTTVEVLTKVEGSFFRAALSKDWRPQPSAVLDITRNGTHFQHVLDYLRFGYIPRDVIGRCNIPIETLQELREEADFYGLPILIEEIDRSVEFSLRGMRYFISSFYLNDTIDSGGLKLKEYSTYEQALAAYNKVKDNLTPGRTKFVPCKADYCRYVRADGLPNDHYGGGVAVREEVNKGTGEAVFEVFDYGGPWKCVSSKGTQLLCIPITDKVADDGALYHSMVRTVPDNLENGTQNYYGMRANNVADTSPLSGSSASLH